MVESHGKADGLVLQPDEADEAVVQVWSVEPGNCARVVGHQHVMACAEVRRKNIAGIRLVAGEENTLADDGVLHAQQLHVRSLPCFSRREWFVALEVMLTPEGISQWWAPEGFRTDVTRLDLKPDGELVYTMTAVGPQQVTFMEQNGMPLVTESRKRYVEIAEPTKLSYQSLVDFVPDQAPYEQLTEIEFQPSEGGTRIVMRIEPMHDEVWTDRLVAGRSNELDNLARLVS